MDNETFRHRVARLEALLQEKLGVRGRSLEKRFARAGRSLPRRVQKAGRIITSAEANLHHPKLSRLHDPKTLESAFSEVTAHLKTVDPADRRKGVILGVFGGLVFNLLLLVAAVLLVLRWQGALG